MNWNEKRLSKSSLLTMDHEIIRENSNSAAFYTLPNTIIYLKVVKYSNSRLRQVYWAGLELKIKLQKIEDRMLCYGCKD